MWPGSIDVAMFDNASTKDKHFYAMQVPREQRFKKSSTPSLSIIGNFLECFNAKSSPPSPPTPSELATIILYHLTYVLFICDILALFLATQGRIYK